MDDWLLTVRSKLTGTITNTLNPYYIVLSSSYLLEEIANVYTKLNMEFSVFSISSANIFKLHKIPLEYFIADWWVNEWIATCDYMNIGTVSTLDLLVLYIGYNGKKKIYNSSVSVIDSSYWTSLPFTRLSYVRTEVAPKKLHSKKDVIHKIYKNKHIVENLWINAYDSEVFRELVYNRVFSNRYISTTKYKGVIYLYESTNMLEFLEYACRLQVYIPCNISRVLVEALDYNNSRAIRVMMCNAIREITGITVSNIYSNIRNNNYNILELVSVIWGMCVMYNSL